MDTGKDYLFTSARLGFRNWLAEDLSPMTEINSDEKVMAFFPGTYAKDKTAEFIRRMQQQYKDKGFCYFAVDSRDTREFIGFIGLSEPAFEATFTPCIDIGWRLKTSVWNKGYATEGAIRCLQYAFDTLNLDKVNCIAPKVNQRSIRVMEKIGMQKIYEFEHPLLLNDERLRTCVLYEKLSK